MPRCFSISIQSEAAWRVLLRALTVPATLIAPPSSSSGDCASCAFFSAVIAPRLGPVTKRDYVAQLRFSMLLGVCFCVIGAIGFALGAPLVGLIAAGFALFAALMRAAFGICLGRGPYMVVSRLRGEVPACCQNK